MSDAPERIWACMDGPMVGLFVSGGYNAGWPEYVRADLFGAVKAERDALTAENAALKARVAADDALIYDAWLGLRVLRTVITKAKLSAGLEATAQLITRIETAHPEFAPKSALRSIGETP